MKILVDMNLSPVWAGIFKEQGWDAKFWADVGKPTDMDYQIMSYAAANGYIVFTNDLDFGSILAVEGGKIPSVIQLRTEDVRPHKETAALVVNVLKECAVELANGALVTIEPRKFRVRLLPISK